MGAQGYQAVTQRAAESRHQSERVLALLPHEKAPSLRALFARCAISLALEHHSGIVRLVQAGEYGTAAALLRPLLEASTIGYWLMYVADCGRIRSLPTNVDASRSPDIPQLDHMAAKLVPIFPPIKALVEGLKNNGPATWLHKYTHGGMPQLLRRADGWAEPYVMHMLITADLFAVLGACLETVIAPNPELSAYGFSCRDKLGAELSRRFGVPMPPKQPHELPTPLADGCGDPFCR